MRAYETTDTTNLSGEELELFLQYLHRFANHDVDQFVLMDDYRVNLSRAPEPGTGRS